MPAKYLQNLFTFINPIFLSHLQPNLSINNYFVVLEKWYLFHIFLTMKLSILSYQFKSRPITQLPFLLSSVLLLIYKHKSSFIL